MQPQSDLPLDDEEHREGDPTDDLRAGDVVVVPFPTVREKLGCLPEAGLLLENRRNVTRAWFPTRDHTLWVERRHLEAIAEDRIPVHPLILRLHRVARRLDAELVELYDKGESRGVFHVFSRGLELDDLVYVRDLLGEDLLHMRVDPGSVRRTRLTLGFSWEPPPPTST